MSFSSIDLSVAVCICCLSLLINESAMAEDSWKGIFGGRTVLEAGVSLPVGLYFDNQKIQFDCDTYDFQFPGIVRYCEVKIELDLACGSIHTVAITSNPSLNENLVIEPVITTSDYISAEYSIAEDTWIGKYHFFPEQFCSDTNNPYVAVEDFFVSFTLKRYKSGQSLLPVYLLLLD